LPKQQHNQPSFTILHYNYSHLSEREQSTLHYNYSHLSEREQSTSNMLYCFLSNNIYMKNVAVREF